MYMEKEVKKRTLLIHDLRRKLVLILLGEHRRKRCVNFLFLLILSLFEQDVILRNADDHDKVYFKAAEERQVIPTLIEKDTLKHLKSAEAQHSDLKAFLFHIPDG